jgi:hypothetical protein
MTSTLAPVSTWGASATTIQQPDAVIQWRLGTVEAVTCEWIAHLNILTGQPEAE